MDTSRSDYEANLAYTDVSTDFQTGEVHCDDPRAFVAKHKRNDPDMPSHNDTVTGEHYDEYIKAMKVEISQLSKQKTWTPDVPTAQDGSKRPILRGTWGI